jgi:hypothetical protein
MKILENETNLISDYKFSFNHIHCSLLMFILNEHEDGHGHRHGNGHGHSKIQTLDTGGIACPMHSKKKPCRIRPIPVWTR